MKEIKFTKHAEENIIEREIDIDLLFDSIENFDFKIIQSNNRFVLMRIYFDLLLKENMLFRIIVEKTDDLITVVTVYKTSKIDKYLKGLI